MKNVTKLFFCILCLMATAHSIDSLETKIPGTAEDYFPFIVGMVKHFEVLEPYATGETRYGYHICTETDNIKGERFGLIEEIMFLGPMKIKNTQIYAISGNQVFLAVTEGPSGKTKYTTRPIILKMPKTKEEIVEWSYHHERGKDTVYKCEAKYLPVLETQWGEFRHLIIVKKSTYSDGDLWGVEKEYYAKDYGLVKCERFNPQGELVGMASYEVSKIEK